MPVVNSVDTVNKQEKREENSEEARRLGTKATSLGTGRGGYRE